MGQSHSSAYIDSNAALEAVRDGDASRVQGIIRALKKREATSSQEEGSSRKHGVLHDTRDEEGRSLLLVSIDERQEKVTSLLISYGCDPCIPDQKFRYPLLEAIRAQHCGLVKECLKSDDMNILYSTSNENSENCLHLAIRGNNEAIFKLIADRCDVFMLNWKSQSRILPIVLAAALGKLRCVTYLTERPEVNINGAGERSGKTCLHYGCENNCVPIVRTLYEAGALMNVSMRNGFTLLHTAAESSSWEVFRYLLTLGSSIELDARDCRGRMASHIIASKIRSAKDLDAITCLQGFAHLLPAALSYVDDFGKRADDYLESRVFALEKEEKRNGEESRKKKEKGKQKQPSHVLKHIPELANMMTAPEVVVKNTASGLQMQYCSDLHLEFGDTPDVLVSSPFLALLGDIGLVTTAEYKNFLLDMADKFEKVFVILGNHEFYHGNYAETLAIAESICEQHESLYFMHRNAVLVNGVMVLGCTLWSYIGEEEYNVIASCMSDYKVIRVHEDLIECDSKELRFLRPADTVGWHGEDVEWLQRELQKAEEQGIPTVVLTHHAPLKNCASSHPDFMGDRVQESANSACCTDLRPLLKRYGNSILRAWLYGHTHWFQDMTVEGVRVCSNPYGYPMEQRKQEDYRAMPDPEKERSYHPAKKIVIQ